MDLLAVKLDSHLVGSRNQIWVDLHVHLIVIVVILPIFALHVLFIAVISTACVSLTVFLV